ncbi:MAG: DUF547 domain-containing protein [Thermoanaerobaculia bacterium]
MRACVVPWIVCDLLLVATVARAGSPDTGPWDSVLRGQVRDGGLDYAGAAADRSDLDRFLAVLAAVEPARMNADEQLAFWINAYNAVTVHFVLERYPELTSVREVSGFFDRQRFRVAGAERTLDEIEDAARALGDPRVHFALVCASSSCPDLRAEAYVPERLEEQLEDQLQVFLASPAKGLRYDEADNELHLSSIFKWYAGDFTGGSTLGAFFFRGGVLDWVKERVPGALAARLEARAPALVYLDYDWSLNDR